MRRKSDRVLDINGMKTKVAGLGLQVSRSLNGPDRSTQSVQARFLSRGIGQSPGPLVSFLHALWKNATPVAKRDCASTLTSTGLDEAEFVLSASSSSLSSMALQEDEKRRAPEPQSCVWFKDLPAGRSRCVPQRALCAKRCCCLGVGSQLRLQGQAVGHAEQMRPM